MFNVESTVRQLKPDFILQHVLEAEEGQWSRVHLGQDVEDSISIAPASASSNTSSSLWDFQDPGLLLLRHGTSVRKIHRYFSQLEFRKCCLHLAGRKSTFQSMRVVHSSGTNLEDESIKRRRAPLAYVTHLEDKELRAFKHAYLCAAYPALAAPEPPSPFTPSPVHTGSGSSSHRSAQLPTSSSGVVTPHSLHDNGLEESEDLAFIPSESICAHLQRAFHLTDDKFRDYRYLINKTYVRKSAQKLLAEELAGQLAVLENNTHPFYRPMDFLPPMGYEIWRKAENNHITELLGKFWHYSLPFPRNSQDLIAELHSVHDDYRILLNKLMAYERDFHRQAEEEGGMLVSPLSTASVRLLKEFGLRYGVGEQFRRILYLDQVSVDFSPSLWYLRHLLSVVGSVSDLLPSNRRALAMVKKEYDLLHSSLVRLATQTSKAMEQMKSLFPNNKPAGGVELLIEVLQRVRELRVYLQTSAVQEVPSLHAVLTEIIQGMFFQTYEKCKTVIRTELKYSRDTHVCPQMLNAVIMEMRDEVLDYRNNFEAVFKVYFDITVMASKAFYTLLMKDVESLCQQEERRESAIDLRMLALVHRLNQLDRDWSAYIRPQDQTWRQSFKTHMAQWTMALQLHVQDLVLEAIAGDAFVTQQLQMPVDSSPPWTSSSSSPRTTRSMSLTPSVHSAFSSCRATPTQGSLGNIPHGGSLGKVSDVHAPTPPPSTSQPNSSNMKQADDFLSFADKRRHCASVPVFTERPAIVRVMSEVKMSKQVQDQGLKTASAMEDLSGGGNSSQNITQLRGAFREGSAFRSPQQPAGWSRGASQSSLVTEREVHILDSVDDVEEVERAVLQIGDSTLSDVDSNSESPDEEFTFPPVHEVTDLNISDSNMSYKEGTPIEELRQKKPSKKKEGRMAGPLRSISQEKEQEEKLRGPGGRRSCPPPVQIGIRTVSAVSPEREELHAFKPVPQRLRPAQVSALRKISQSSIESESEHQFLQSVQSTVSFPTPGLSQEAVIPVSGSIVDLIILLQRTLGFGRTLCQAIFRPLYRGQVAGNGSVQGVREVGEAEGEETAALKSALQSSHANTHFSFVKVLCQGINVYADNMLCLDLCAVPKDMAKRTIGSRLVEHAMQQRRAGKIWGCRHQLEGLLTCYAFHNRKANYLSERYEPVTQKMCVRINNVMACQRFLEWCQRQTQDRSLYCPHFAAAAAATGEAIFRLIENEIEVHHIPWENCLAFGSDNANVMVGRKKGVYGHLLEKHPKMYLSGCVCHLIHIAAEKGSSSEAESSSSRVHPQSSSTDGKCRCSNSSSTSDLQRQCIEQTTTHLMAVWTALCRLLAFRMNLFLRDGLTLLLSLKPPSVSIATCLLPLTQFLRSHFDALSSWLYSRSFRRVLEFLWIYIVQDIETEACKLQMDRNHSVSPHNLLQALTHLMRFMNNCEKGITRELLLSQADDVVTKLQLFTLSTLHLIALYLNLMERYSDMETMMSEEARNCSVPVRALHQLHRDLQTRRKCFSGRQLFAWIMRNADLFLSSDELSLCGGNPNISDQGAIAIAQQLMDMQLIVDVEAENAARSPTPSSSMISTEQYPEVSVHDQLQVGATDCTSTSTGYHDNDTDLTPTPTPVHMAGRQSVDTEVHVPLPSSDSSTTPQCSHDADVLIVVSTSQPADVSSLTTHQATANGVDAVGAHSIAAVNMLKTQEDAEKDSSQAVFQQQDSAQNVLRQNSQAQSGVTQRDSDKNGITQGDSDKNGVTQGDSTQNGVTQGDSSQNGVTQGDSDKNGVTQGDSYKNGVSQGDSTQNGVTQGDNTQNGVTQGDSSPYEIAQKDSSPSGVTQEDLAQNAVTQKGSRVDTVTQDDGNKNTATQEDSAQNVVAVEGDSSENAPAERSEQAPRSFHPDQPQQRDMQQKGHADPTPITPDESDSTGEKPVVVGASVNEGVTVVGEEPTLKKVTEEEVVPQSPSPDVKVVEPKTQFGAGTGMSDFEDSGVAEGQEIILSDEPESLSSAKPGSYSSNTAEPLPAASSTTGLTAQLSANSKAASASSFQRFIPTPQYELGEGSVYDLDMNSICPTPLTFMSMTPYHSVTSVFDNGTERFYFMPPNPLAGPHPRQHHHRSRQGAGSMSQLDRTLLHLKNSEETSSLAERCFTLKLTPLSILMVLHNRRKTDELARNFMQQLPTSVLEQVSSGIENRSAECSVL